MNINTITFQLSQLTYFKVNSSTGQISIEQVYPIRQGRPPDDKATGGIVLAGVWQCDSQDECQEGEEKREKELGDDGWPEPQSVVETFQEQSTELLHPQP